VPGVSVLGNADADVTGIQYDSRLVRPGDLFAALRGADFDGHQYIDQAIANGAAALLLEADVDTDVPRIMAPDSRAALAPLAASFYGHPGQELDVIGITGTDGKTTTSFLVDHILRATGHVTGLIGTVGIRVGPDVAYTLPHQTTPESNLIQGFLREMVERGVTHAILEATSHGLAMHRLDTVRFRIAGVTNMTHEHLEYHGTVERYWRAKAMLVERVAAEHGVVVINADDRGAMSAMPYATGAEVMRTSSCGNPAEITASELDIRADGTSFTVSVGGERARVAMPLIGSFNVDNALIAIGIGLAAGLALPGIAASLRTASGVPGRMQVIDEGQPFGVVVDYAHTPESLRKILALLRSIQRGRIIVVSGSAGERDPGKRPLQGRVCAEGADISIFTNEDPRNEDPGQIIDAIALGAIQHGGIERETVHRIVDRREAIAHAFALANPGDMVLLAGKGHEQSIIIGYDHTPWDEATVARDLIRERTGS
jgi:UDP-N-acetylmuramoyl-L-alanyl-D-glutamate--2,6-diaminopimelate ligase